MIFKASGLIAKKAEIEISSGKVNISDNNIDETMIKISSGSVKITDKRNREDIGFIIKTSYDSISVFGVKYKEMTDDLTNKAYKYNITTSSGSVKIS